MRDDIKAALDRYAEHHIETGGFLLAVLRNDLSDAVGRADDGNIKNLAEIVRYVYNDLPDECWGSRVKVDAWLATRVARVLASNEAGR